MKPLVLEANTKVLAFVDMPLDPYYESSKLKDTTDGVYTDVFDGFSYGDYDAEEAAQILLDGVSCAERQRLIAIVNGKMFLDLPAGSCPVIRHGGAGYLC